MELSEYLKRFKDDEAGLHAFAESVGATVGHLRNVAYGSRVASAALARQIALRTEDAVPVHVLRPKDWHLIWGQPVIVRAEIPGKPDGCTGIVSIGNGAAPQPQEPSHAGA